MKILFVVDQLPFPPRNGVTVPTFGYINKINSLHSISLLYCCDDITGIDVQNIQDNKSNVEKLWILKINKIGKLRALVEEIFALSKYFLGWDYDRIQLLKCMESQRFDAVWGSPIGVAGVMRDLKTILDPGTFFIAGISDCYTAVLKNILKKELKNRSNYRACFFGLMQYVRSLWFGRYETKILSRFDLILVQTEADKNILDSISAGRLNKKVMVASNGVNKELFQLPLGQERTDILFVGNFCGEYKSVFEWLLDEVWPIIRTKNYTSKFVVIGKNASSELRQRFKEDERIEHIEFLADLKDVYRGRAVLLAPVFKNYGLINKVIEAMASGVVVVGDQGSFNGIPGFEKGRHGIIAENAENMANETLKILFSSETRDMIANAARALISKEFSWDKNLERIYNRITMHE